MTNDQIDDEALAARITDALHHRAAAVAVDDRLDSITDGLFAPGGLAPVHALVPSPPGRRAASRLVFAAAAVLVAAAFSLALWQRGSQQPLSPVSGPTPADARIYPILDPATLEGIGLTPDPQAAIQGTMSSTTGPALVLRRVSGDGPGDVITVWVASSADVDGVGVAVPPDGADAIGSDHPVRYERDVADATIVVDGPRDTGPTSEALIADLTVIPQDGELPLITLDAAPDGWEVLAGPSVPTVEVIPVLNLAYGTGTASLNVTRQPSFVPQNELTPVQVGGRAGYLSELEGQGFTLTWALAEEGWWAQMVGYGVSRDQALALAEGVTFTDKAVWSARYPASTATDPGDLPPPTIAQP